MKILLTNDDGIDAIGLATLERAVADMGEIVVYAPAQAHSGCSHRLTVDEPFSLEDRGKNRFAVHGTPGDCVRIALALGAGDADLILSGINDGGNLGCDVFYSGTVAAIREGTFHGKPGIALSHYVRRRAPMDWDQVGQWARSTVEQLLGMPVRPDEFWSVNFPHPMPDDPPPEVIFAPLDLNPMPLAYDPLQDGHKYSGVYANRPRTPGSDIDICFRGDIAITKLSINHGCQGSRMET